MKKTKEKFNINNFLTKFLTSICCSNNRFEEADLSYTTFCFPSYDKYSDVEIKFNLLWWNGRLTSIKIRNSIHGNTTFSKLKTEEKRDLYKMLDLYRFPEGLDLSKTYSYIMLTSISSPSIWED